jgi:hypothetical protein
VIQDFTIRQVWVIQCKSTGAFLTSDLSYSTSLKRAGRLHDKDEAITTASGNLDDDFEVHTFFEVEQFDQATHRHYG